MSAPFEAKRGTILSIAVREFHTSGIRVSCTKGTIPWTTDTYSQGYDTTPKKQNNSYYCRNSRHHLVFTYTRHTITSLKRNKWYWVAPKCKNEWCLTRKVPHTALSDICVLNKQKNKDDSTCTSLLIVRSKVSIETPVRGLFGLLILLGKRKQHFTEVTNKAALFCKCKPYFKIENGTSTPGVARGSGPQTAQLI